MINVCVVSSNLGRNHFVQLIVLNRKEGWTETGEYIEEFIETSGYVKFLVETDGYVLLFAESGQFVRLMLGRA